MTRILDNNSMDETKKSFPYGNHVASLPWVNLIFTLPIVSLLAFPALAADLNGGTALPTTKPAPAAAAAEPGPLDLSLTYTGELWQNDGGLKTGSDYMYGFDASLTINLQKLFNIPDAKIYVEGYYVGGQSLDFKYTGALQAPSSLDAFQSQNLGHLYQLYYEQQIGGTNILFGKYDVQTQFGTTHPMDLFADKAQAMNLPFLAAGDASGLNGASVYPTTSLGVRIRQTINDQWSVKLGLLDGESDSPAARTPTDFVFGQQYGALGVGEVDYTPLKNTKLMAGIWGETGHLNVLGAYTPTFAPVQTWGMMGEYFGGATRLYTLPGGGSIDGFFNGGFASPATSITSNAFDAGLTFTGLIPFRPTDKFGVAAAIEQNSPGFQKLLLLSGTTLAQYESDYEATYRAKITDWLNVQPEADYIVHPSIAGAKSALAFGLHFELHKDFN